MAYECNTPPINMTNLVEYCFAKGNVLHFTIDIDLTQYL